MLKHMAFVEDHWFARFLHGHEGHPPWNTVDWKTGPDWDWNSAIADTPEQLHDLWHGGVDRSRALVTEALTNRSLDQLAKRSWPNGESPSLRWIICHLIEEYARHNGHADLIRESIDGLTGE